MPVTQDSFRSDPRRRVKLRALRGFFVEGREKPVVEDEVVDLPMSVASGLIHSNKAVTYEGDVAVGQRVPNKDREQREANAKLARCPTCGQHLHPQAPPVAEAGGSKKAS